MEKPLWFVVVVFALVSAACGGGGGGGSDAPSAFRETADAGDGDTVSAGITFTYSGSGVAVEHPSIDTAAGPASVTYRVNLGRSSRDVYFILSNPSQTDATAAPAVTPLAVDPLETLRRATKETQSLVPWARLNGLGISGTPDIEIFNADPWSYGGIPRRHRAGTLSAPALLAVDAVGNTGRFYDAWDRQISATCRKVIAADGKTVNVWVADDAWAGGGCSKSRCVTPAMLDALGERFLKPGGDNDIYDAATTIFGGEWGDHSYGNMIPRESPLTLFIHDIHGDNSPSGGVLGYFYARDNFRASAHATSNERLLLALDSVMFANPTGPSWEIADYWPQEFLATLGHEMQHMIHFYQKGVLRESTSSTWLNEMCSLAAEDLLSTRLGIAGPRGVSPLDGSAGGAGNEGGRLGRFNYYDYLSLTRWLDGSLSDSGEGNRLNSYALNYAFGAYLARNYGGAAFFRNLVQNSYGDTRAIDTALGYGGYSDDFASALQKWGAAIVLSDRTGADVPQGYRYNTGGFFNSTLDGSLFRLGSINLYNYTHAGLNGPRFFTSVPAAGAGRHATSNLIYRLGTGLTGTVSHDLTLPQGMRLTVVVK